MENTFGLRLRVARDAAGITQHALAQALGVQDSVLSRYEQDICVPATDRVQALAALLSVTAGWLHYGDGEGPAVTHDPRERRGHRASPHEAA